MSSESKEQGAAQGCAVAFLHSLKAASRIPVGNSPQAMLPLGSCLGTELCLETVRNNSLGPGQTQGETMLVSVQVGLSFCAQECSLAEFILLIQLQQVCYLH